MSSLEKVKAVGSRTCGIKISVAEFGRVDIPLYEEIIEVLVNSMDVTLIVNSRSVRRLPIFSIALRSATLLSPVMRLFNRCHELMVSSETIISTVLRKSWK